MKGFYINAYNKNEIKDKWKKEFPLVIIFTSLVLVIILLAIFSLSFFSKNKNTEGTIELGELDFSIVPENLGNVKIVPNTTVLNKIKVINARDLLGKNYAKLCDIVVRYNIRAYVNEGFDEYLTGQILTAHSNPTQFVSDLNYTYYCDIIKPGGSRYIFDKLGFSNNIGNNYQGKNIVINVSVEALQAQQGAYKEVWKDAPIEWKNIIEQKLTS